MGPSLSHPSAFRPFLDYLQANLLPVAVPCHPTSRSKEPALVSRSRKGKGREVIKVQE